MIKHGSSTLRALAHTQLTPPRVWHPRAQVVSWLQRARAQGVAVVDVRGRAGATHWLVVATGLSQRHAEACCQAVHHQVRVPLGMFGPAPPTAA
jgi:hypothetical protein